MNMKDPVMTLDLYSTRPVGTTGHELLVDGEVVGWTVNHYWALRLLALLVEAEEEENK